MKKYIIYLLPLIFITTFLYSFLSFPKITVDIREPEGFTITEFLGEIILFRNGKEVSIDETPFPLHSKDEINVKPFSGLTVMAKDSSILICQPLTNLSIIDEKVLDLKNGTLEWRRGKSGFEIHLKNNCVLHPSGSGKIEVNGKIHILSLKNESVIKIDGREERVGELERIVIDSGNLTKEKIEKPPEILSPRENEVYGNWTEDFGMLNVSVEYLQKYDQFQLEISPDPYFLSTMFTVFFTGRDSRVPLERIGTGRRFARVVPLIGKSPGIPSEPVEFFVKAFPLSRVSDRGVPPKIDIYSVILSGNIVIVKGRVDRNCRLFVNKEEVSPEPNGEFNVPVTFNDIGEKWLEIEAVSPNGLRTTKRQRVFLVGY